MMSTRGRGEEKLDIPETVCASYPHQIPGVAETCSLEHVKQHYYRSHPSVNPTRIVPKGPIIDYSTPHGRERMST